MRCTSKCMFHYTVGRMDTQAKPARVRPFLAAFKAGDLAAGGPQPLQLSYTGPLKAGDLSAKQVSLNADMAPLPGKYRESHASAAKDKVKEAIGDKTGDLLRGLMNRKKKKGMVQDTRLQGNKKNGHRGKTPTDYRDEGL